MEAASYAQFALQSYLTVHLFSKHLGNGQAKTHAGLEHVILPEDVEYLTLAAALNAATGILHVQFHSLLIQVIAPAQPYGSLTCELECILDVLAQYGLDPGRIDNGIYIITALFKLELEHLRDIL